MGGSSYSNEDYRTRASSFASKGYKSAFVHDEDIKTGKAVAKVHPTLDPKGVKIRESRDSAAHPITVPIIIVNDLTGSMQEVPKVLQKEEPKLMGLFLNDKASGKKYLGDGYPAIMIAGVDDYFARMYGYDGQGALQIGQFESGIEIDENLGNLWLTGNGGGNHGESYDLALYFAARHTAHDHHDKRGRKGFLFIFGDEPIFDEVAVEAVYAVIGDSLEANLPIAQVIKEARKLYHIFWGTPQGHEDYDGHVEKVKKLLGPEAVRIFDPKRVCEFIVQTVAMVEGAATIDDLIADGAASAGDRMALARLADVGLGNVAAAVPGVLASSGKGVSRL